MALTTSNWDGKKVQIDVIQAYTENTIVPIESYMRAVGPEAQSVFPNISARTAKNAADGTGTLAIASVTETATTLSADTPLKVWEYIPLSNVNTSPVNFLSSYTQRLGADLADAQDKRLVNFAAKTAIASGTTVLFDDEGTGSAVVAAFKDIAVQYDVLKTPQDNRHLFVQPATLGKVYDQAQIRSGDYISGADNKMNMTRLQFMGLNIYSGSFNFNVDTSADANYPSKYQVALNGAQPYLGASWHKNALAVQFFEEANVKSSFQDPEESYLVVARCQFGTAAVRGTNFICLRGDV